MIKTKWLHFKCEPNNVVTNYDSKTKYLDKEAECEWKEQFLHYAEYKTKSIPKTFKNLEEANEYFSDLYFEMMNDYKYLESLESLESMED